MLAFCDKGGIPPEARITFSRQDQEEYLQHSFPRSKGIVVAELADGDAMMADLYTPEYMMSFLDGLAGSETAEVIITSFSRAVMDCAGRSPVVARPLALSSLRRTVSIGGRPATYWEPPLDEAVQILGKFIAERGDAGVRQSDLRAPLSSMDARFQKRPGQPAGQMKALRVEAERRGLIRVEGSDPNPTLYSAAARTVPAVVSDVSTQQVGAGRDLRPRTEETPAPTARLSERYERFLRDENLGPFVKGRGVAWDTLEESGVVDGETLTDLLGRLARKAQDAVREKWGTDVPAGRFRQFLANIFDRADVLLDENDEPIRPGLRTLASSIGTLAPGWRDRCEEELLIALVDAFPITSLTLRDVAFCIFNDGDEGLARVEKLVAGLLETGRLGVDDDRLTMGEASGAPVAEVVPALGPDDGHVRA